jgi:hypothetical protein
MQVWLPVSLTYVHYLYIRKENAMSVAQYSGKYLKNHMSRARRICKPDIIKLNFPILLTKKNGIVNNQSNANGY